MFEKPNKGFTSKRYWLVYKSNQIKSHCKGGPADSSQSKAVLPQVVVRCALNFKTTNHYYYSNYLLFKSLKYNSDCRLRGESNWQI